MHCILRQTRSLKSRRLRWAGYVARMELCRNAYRVLVGKPEGKRSLGSPRGRWEVGCHAGDLAQDRDQWRAYVRAAMDLRIP